MARTADRNIVDRTVDRDVEAGLLVSMLIRPECARSILPFVAAADFSDPAHRDIFSAIAAICRSGKPLLSTLVAKHLDEHAQAIPAGQAGQALVELSESHITAAHAPIFLAELIEASKKRTLLARAASIVQRGPRGISSAEIADELSSLVAQTRKTSPHRLATLPGHEFHAQDDRHNWLIDGVIGASQGGVAAGKSKSLKTSIALDAAISIATGTPFLGCWHAPTAVPCGILSAESGGATIRETMGRIAAAKRIPISDLEQLHIGVSVPNLTTAHGIDMLEDLVSSRKLRCVFVDPTYRAAPGVDDTQLSRMAELLFPLSDLIDRTGCSLVMVHHNRKSPAKQGDHYQPPTLDDIGGTGWQQWARFWVLLNKRQEWDPELGKHSLHLVTGSSAGGGTQHWLDVLEGRTCDPGGRVWDVALKSPSEGVAAQRSERELSRKSRDVARQVSDADAVTQALGQHLDATAVKSELKVGTGFRSARLQATLELLLVEGRVERTRIRRANGQSYEAYKLGAET